MIYTNPDGSVTGEGCTAYMRYENRLRALETRFGSVVGSTAASTRCGAACTAP